jgi:hypothetical protein
MHASYQDGFVVVSVPVLLETLAAILPSLSHYSCGLDHSIEMSTWFCSCLATNCAEISCYLHLAFANDRHAGLEVVGSL